MPAEVTNIEGQYRPGTVDRPQVVLRRYPKIIENRAFVLRFVKVTMENGMRAGLRWEDNGSNAPWHGDSSSHPIVVGAVGREPPFPHPRDYPGGEEECVSGKRRAGNCVIVSWSRKPVLGDSQKRSEGEMRGN